MGMERFPGHDRSNQEQPETNVSQANVYLLVVSGARFARLKTLPVFLNREHGFEDNAGRRARQSPLLTFQFTLDR